MLQNGVLTIKVKEYPIVQSIIFEGIKANKFKEELYDKISLKEKNPYNKLLLKGDLNLIKNIFKRSGYYFVEIKLEEITNQNNTVDLIYNVDMGNKALIKKINFIGDKKYKDRKLHSVITSEEAKFWKFISRNIYLNNQRIELDKRLLKNYYLSKEFKFQNFLESQNFINKVGEIAENEGHHPDIAFGWGYAKVKIFTHAIKGLHESDFVLAAKVDKIS